MGMNRHTWGNGDDPTCLVCGIASREQLASDCPGRTTARTDLSSMTLADAEALAARLETAARTIRDALAMMGGATAVPSRMTLDRYDAPVSRSIELVAPASSVPVLMTNKGPVRLTDEELAQKAALRAQREADEFAADRAKLAGTP